MNEKDKKAETIKIDAKAPVIKENETIAPAKVVKMGLNLEKTLEVVSLLHKRAMHLKKLNQYSEKLQEFEMAGSEEDLINQKSYYTGCVLNLKDDNGRSFELRNPVVIGDVCKFLKAKFEEKAAELEAEIVLP